MAKYTDVVYQKSFSAKNMKDAYLKACKWYASSVLSKDELHDVQVEFIKSTEGQLPTITARLFVSVEEKDVKEHHCAICRESHSSFFMSEETNCAWCKIAAFDRRIAQQLAIKRSYIKSKIERKQNYD